jgi:hypothetical protein
VAVSVSFWRSAGTCFVAVLPGINLKIRVGDIGGGRPEALSIRFALGLETVWRLSIHSGSVIGTKAFLVLPPSNSRSVNWMRRIRLVCVDVRGRQPVGIGRWWRSICRPATARRRWFDDTSPLLVFLERSLNGKERLPICSIGQVFVGCK